MRNPNKFIILFFSLLLISDLCNQGLAENRKDARRIKKMTLEELQEEVIKQADKIKELERKTEWTKYTVSGLVSKEYDFKNGLRSVTQSLVVILCKKDSEISPPRITYGSGVIIDKEGFVLTNYHVVADQDVIKVRTTERLTYLAKKVGEYKHLDLAVLKIERKKDGGDRFYAISLGNSNYLSIGQKVYAFGNPFALAAEDAQPSMSAGVVSALHKLIVAGTDCLYADSIQTDAALNPGNSGGPLVDSTGRLVGINGLIRTRSGTNSGVGFAIPIDLIKVFLDDMKKGESIYWPQTGFVFDEASENKVNFTRLTRVKIVKIIKDSPAEKISNELGIKEGDFLMEINGKPIYNMSNLMNFLAYIPAGKKIKMKVRKNSGSGAYVDFDMVTVSELTSNFERDAKKALDLLTDRKLEEAYKLYKSLIEKKPGNQNILYDMACACSLMKKNREAIDYLRKAFEAGYSDIEHVINDTDLDSIKSEAEFKELIKKYKG